MVTGPHCPSLVPVTGPHCLPLVPVTGPHCPLYGPGDRIPLPLSGPGDRTPLPASLPLGPGDRISLLRRVPVTGPHPRRSSGRGDRARRGGPASRTWAPVTPSKRAEAGRKQRRRWRLFLAVASSPRAGALPAPHVRAPLRAGAAAAAGQCGTGTERGSRSRPEAAPSGWGHREGSGEGAGAPGTPETPRGAGGTGGTERGVGQEAPGGESKGCATGLILPALCSSTSSPSQPALCCAPVCLS
ncbi:bcl-2-binding component 3, isoforms 3/4-like [Phaenicophaeus curvirostris]|uniref:bcl-2-binding component 3, isoforms 3/4-like n=1 Tax=Phaenicophaeus curvirostris TaxID=33595 RepID=UPI0037F0A56C